MGWTYEGPYRHEINAYQHEGYAVAVIDGAEQSESWLYHDENPAAQLRAACGCGWRGQFAYAVTEAGEDQAQAEWDHEHLQPMIAKAVGEWPAWAARIASIAQAAVSEADAGKFDDAAQTIARLVTSANDRLTMASELAAQAEQKKGSRA